MTVIFAGSGLISFLDASGLDARTLLNADRESCINVVD